MRQTPLVIIVQLIMIMLNISIVYYLYHLESIGCKCALNNKRAYIYGYTIFIIIFAIIQLFTDIIQKIMEKYIIIPLVLVGLGITNIALTLQYISDMKKDNCNCSDPKRRDMLYILTIMEACLWGGMIIFFIGLVLYLEYLISR